jgi:hypothetical protein
MPLTINSDYFDASAGSRMTSTAGTMKIAMRDTTDIQEKIDLSRYADGKVVNPTSLVVVSQFPKAGEQVPKGTKVTLTFMAKDSIPVKDIAELSDEFQTKYAGGSVKAVTDDILSAEEVKRSLEKKKSYASMTATEKKAVKEFAVEKGIVESEPDDTVAKKLYGDLAFIYSI